jgi:hypothetical protein
LNLALYHLGDASILADIHRYQSLYLKLQQLKKENALVSYILEGLLKEQEGHNKEIALFLEEVRSI